MVKWSEVITTELCQCITVNPVTHKRLHQRADRHLQTAVSLLSHPSREFTYSALPRTFLSLMGKSDTTRQTSLCVLNTVNLLYTENNHSTISEMERNLVSKWVRGSTLAICNMRAMVIPYCAESWAQDLWRNGKAVEIRRGGRVVLCSSLSWREQQKTRPT